MSVKCVYSSILLKLGKMCVDTQGDFDIVMTEELLRGFDVDARIKEHTGVCVTKLVSCKLLHDPNGLLPAQSNFTSGTFIEIAHIRSPCTLICAFRHLRSLYGCTDVAVRLFEFDKNGHKDIRYRHVSNTCLCFRGFYRGDVIEDFQRFIDPDDPFIKVNILPCKRKTLSAAKAGIQHYHTRMSEPVTSPIIPDKSNLLRSERLAYSGFFDRNDHTGERVPHDKIRIDGNFHDPDRSLFDLFHGMCGIVLFCKLADNGLQMYLTQIPYLQLTEGGKKVVLQYAVMHMNPTLRRRGIILVHPYIGKLRERNAVFPDCYTAVDLLRDLSDLAFKSSCFQS